ncbi:MAG: response regulator transcription factor [Bacteroidia bacterium]|nr:response regulator transcription factor [Bacteroidia bacterium]
MPIKLLYVEDEPNLGKIVKESLESRGFTVEMAADGRDVLDAYRRAAPQLAVLDVMLPHKDGFTLARELRSLDPQLPILFLTAKTQVQDVLAGFAAGGNDYLRKPFSMEELIARIENLLRMRGHASAGAGPHDVYELGSYRFYPLKYELHRGASVRTLSHREAQLLRMLADARNRPLERRTILQEVWGDDSFFNSRNLDVYITRLRECLKDDPGVRIVTLKGVGYHFIAEQAPQSR